MESIIDEENHVSILKEKMFEPVKVGNTTFGKEIIFNRKSKNITFTSNYNPPYNIDFKDISRLEIIEINKMKWYIIAALFLFVVIGVVMFLGLIHMPKWILKVHLKETENKKEIIKIRARLRKYEPQLLKNFLNNKLKIEINLRT